MVVEDEYFGASRACRVGGAGEISEIAIASCALDIQETNRTRGGS